MRYWIYQDSRILGPFGPEELSGIEGLGPTSLVCADTQTGTQEMDWAPLESVSELSRIFTATPEAAAIVGGFDRFAIEAHASIDAIGASKNWIEDLEKDARLSDLWGGVPGGFGDEERWEVQRDQGLINRVTELSEKLQIHERKQNEILERLGEKEKLLEEKDRIIAELQDRLRGGAPSVQAPSLQARIQAAPSVRRETRREDWSAPAAHATDDPAPILGRRTPDFEVPEAVPLRGGSGLPESVEFEPPQPTAWGEASAASPEFGLVPPMPQGEESRVEDPQSAGIDLSPPPNISQGPDVSVVPRTMVMGSIPPPTGFPTKQPSWAAPAQENAGGYQDLSLEPPAPVGLPPLPGSSLEPPSPWGASTGFTGGESAVAEEAPPPSAAPAAAAKRLASKKFVIALGASVLVLGGLLYFFLKDPKKVATMVEMGPAGKTNDPLEGAPPPALPSSGASSPVFERSPEPALQTQAPQAAPAEAPKTDSSLGGDFIKDQRIEAIEFVKNYKIPGVNELIAQRLQYYFIGADNLPEWQAGGIDKTKWLVEYRVFKASAGTKSRSPKAVYRFEVDLQEKKIVGLNDRASDLLGAPREAAAPARPAARRKPRAVRRTAISGQDPLPENDDFAVENEEASLGLDR